MTETAITDELIISEIIGGNKQRYSALIQKYNQRLYRITRGYIANEDEIEDIMQDTYVKAYQHLSEFQGRASFSTWVTRILINECLQHLRKQRRNTSESTNEHLKNMSAIDHHTPEKSALNKELGKLIEKSIEALPEKYRVVFIMREIESMNVEETSMALNLTGANVKVRLNRAKEMLRTQLLSEYPAGELYHFNLVRCDRISRNVLARI